MTLTWMGMPRDKKKRREKKRAKKIVCNTTSGTLYKLEVYQVGAPLKIGIGWGYNFDGVNMRPTLINTMGEPLEQGWYNLIVVDDGRLVIFYTGEYYIN